jgi:hypothetical protein
MKQNRESFVSRVFNDQSGQALPILAMALVGLLAMGGLVIDSSHLYYCYNELQASTDASVLAGAELLPNTTATAEAIAYSSVAGGKNAYSNLPNVSMVPGYPLLWCLSSLTNEGIACVAPANANAIQIKQQAVVPTYFFRIFGVKSITVTASATAAMRGAITSPYNVAIIVDTTASMNDTDSDSQCNSTRLTCALSGVQTLLEDLSPCAASVSNCGTATSGNVANSVDRVSLFTFPNVTVGSVDDDYNCGRTSPKSEPYTFPSATATSYPPTNPAPTATYQIVSYSSDYRSSDTATSLVTSSDLVLSVGGKSGCKGMQAEGGEGTYYAGAIYAAQASLVAEQANNPGSQNVIILISDGDASATSSAMTGASTTSGTYPSTLQQCHQAVAAAQAATAAGTRVYSVAYGSESSGCSTDKNPTITPCETMEGIASAPQYFFSDYTQSGSGSTCVSAAQSTTNLDQIFTEIATDFTVARLIPDPPPSS